jgi:hypothetical protein
MKQDDREIIIELGLIGGNYPTNLGKCKIQYPRSKSHLNIRRSGICADQNRPGVRRKF